jgi:hypothetical protein
MAEAGETGESLKWIEAAFADSEQLVKYFAAPHGLHTLQTMFFRLCVRLHRSRSKRMNSRAAKSDPQIERCLHNIISSFNRLVIACLRPDYSTQANIVRANLYLALESLLGPGVVPAKGKETIITTVHWPESSADVPYLTTLQLPYLAMALADLWVIISGRADEHHTVLIQMLELFDHVLTTGNDPKLSEISAEVRADLTGLIDLQDAPVSLTRIRAKCKLPDGTVRSSIWDVGGMMIFVLSNLLFDTNTILPAESIY